MRTSKQLLIGLISVVGLVAVTLIVHSVGWAQFAKARGDSSATAIGGFPHFEKVSNAELKDLILMLKEQVGNLPENEPCAVPPTWSEVIPGDERFVPTTFVDGAGEPAAYCDRQTGLVWETVPSTDTFVWGDVEGFPNAKRHCLNRIVGTNGQKGWRLASIAELASLVDTTSTSCTVDFKCIPDGSPFEIVPVAVYWSASELAGFPTNAWDVNFAIGQVDTFGIGGTIHAWCVRGATDADVY